MRNSRQLRAIAAASLLACLLTAAAAAEESPEPNGPEPPGLTIDPETQPPGAEGSTQPPGAEGSTQAPGTDSDEESARAAPQDRDSMLAELYAHLAKAPDAERAAPIAQTIEGLWLHSGSETIGVLMRRTLQALGEQRLELALKLLDAVVELAPDYAEGWSRRAYVYYLQNDFEHAIGDLRRTLALEPNHFKALEGVARILRESGQKRSALGAYRQLLRIYPHLPGASEAAKELSVEVEGQGI